MKKFINKTAKVLALVSLVIAVCTGKGIETAVVIFNNTWND